jgi:secondary thiamine-phosphate synthase enzyme
LFEGALQQVITLTTLNFIKSPGKLRVMREIIQLKTRQRETLLDITSQVEQVVRNSAVRQGLVNVYAQGATAAIMIQENWDESVQSDVVNLLRKLIPQGVWLHDAQDGNGDSHLKAGLVGPSESIPLIDGKLGLSRWQNIFFCEFDGPRDDRRVVCSVLEMDE